MHSLRSRGMLLARDPFKSRLGTAQEKVKQELRFKRE